MAGAVADSLASRPSQRRHSLVDDATGFSQGGVFAIGPTPRQKREAFAGGDECCHALQTEPWAASDDRGQGSATAARHPCAENARVIVRRDGPRGENA
mmetsp:Transcript_9505/g.24826  ORF Transcript_9505/g.24826 Transcript_9505/m.24826 type:complete len:98 (+) Transcript_9505:1035-1328(+)